MSIIYRPEKVSKRKAIIAIVGGIILICVFVYKFVLQN